jgi:hypothetical protein
MAQNRDHYAGRADIDLGMFEVMDRTACVIDHLSAVLGDHPALNERLRTLYTAAEDALGDLYQESSRLLDGDSAPSELERLAADAHAEHARGETQDMFGDSNE